MKQKEEREALDLQVFKKLLFIFILFFFFVNCFAKTTNNGEILNEVETEEIIECIGEISRNDVLRG